MQVMKDAFCIELFLVQQVNFRCILVFFHVFLFYIYRLQNFIYITLELYLQQQVLFFMFKLLDANVTMLLISESKYCYLGLTRFQSYLDITRFNNMDGRCHSVFLIVLNMHLVTGSRTLFLHLMISLVPNLKHLEMVYLAQQNFKNFSQSVKFF